MSECSLLLKDNLSEFKEDVRKSFASLEYEIEDLKNEVLELKKRRQYTIDINERVVAFTFIILAFSVFIIETFIK